MQPIDPTEVALVARAASGDEQAFGHLYRRHEAAVARFLAGRTDPHLVEDLVSETFTTAWRYLSGFTWHRSTIRPWLFTIARRHLIAQHRRRSSTELVVADPSAAGPCSPRSMPGNLDDEVVETLLVGERVRTGLSLLSPDQEQVVRLRYLDDLSVAETANILRVDCTVVRARSHRALKVLRQTVPPTA